MTLQETIRSLHAYAATEQTGPDTGEFAAAYREIVGGSVGQLLNAAGVEPSKPWDDALAPNDGGVLRAAHALHTLLLDGQLGNRELDAALRSVSEAARKYLDAHGAERDARMDRALDLLCVSADPADPAVSAALGRVNAARGVSDRPHSAQYVKAANFGVDHMNGSGRQGAEYLRQLNRELLAQAKRMSSPDDAEAKAGRAGVKQLLVRKMYLKAAAAPNALVYPEAVEAAARELSADAELMDAVAAAKDQSAQEQVMREHVRRIARGGVERHTEPTAPSRERTASADPNLDVFAAK